MKKNKLIITGLSMALTMGMLVGCGDNNDKITPTPSLDSETIGTEVPDMAPIPSEEVETNEEVDEKFNISDYITEEIVDGKFIIKANNEQYAWTCYDDGLLEIEQEEEAPFISYILTPTTEGQTSINLIGDYQGKRISYYVPLTIDKDLKFNEDYVVDSSIMELEEEIEDVEPVDEDLSTIANKILENIPQDNLPSAIETRMIDMANTDELKYMIGNETLEGLEKCAVSESMISSTAFSIVTLKFDTNDNATKAAETLLTSAPKEKWVCVTAEEVNTKVVDDTYVVLVMGDKTIADTLSSIEY